MTVSLPPAAVPNTVASSDIVLVLDGHTTTRVEEHLLAQGIPAEVTPHEQEGRNSLRCRLGPVGGEEFATFAIRLYASTDPNGYGEWLDRIRSGAEPGGDEPNQRTRHDM